jgi:hypothetical protein
VTEEGFFIDKRGNFLLTEEGFFKSICVRLFRIEGYFTKVTEKVMPKGSTSETKL